METGQIAFGTLIAVVVCYQGNTSCIIHAGMLSKIFWRKYLKEFWFSGITVFNICNFKSTCYCGFSSNTTLQTAC